jgi:hypothetical protein
MNKKLAKLKYLPNNFEIIENGDHVICAISGKLIELENLNYWNVETQEPYYSYVEAHKKKKTTKYLLPSIVRPYPSPWVSEYHFF